MKNHIKELRQKAGLSQYQLAQKAGLTRRGILTIEKHESDPRLSNAHKIALALNVSITDVFVLEENDDK